MKERNINKQYQHTMIQKLEIEKKSRKIILFSIYIELMKF